MAQGMGEIRYPHANVLCELPRYRVAAWLLGRRLRCCPDPGRTSA
jgi:hypothetical protein